MRRMLCAVTPATGRDVWRLEFSDVAADASTGRAQAAANLRKFLVGRP